MVSENASIYAQSGVDTAAGDRAVELMKSAVSRTQGPEVLGGVGGFAGMFDALTSKLQDAFRNLRGLGKISEDNVSEALREVLLARS